MMELKITPSVQTTVKPTALGPVANTDAKLLIYGLFQKGRVLAQDALWFLVRTACFALPVLIMYGFVLSRYHNNAAAWLLFLAALGVYIFASGRIKIRRNLLFLKKRHEHANFFRRNESHIVKAGIGLGSGILGYVIRLLQE